MMALKSAIIYQKMPTKLLLIDALNLIRRIYAVESQQAANDPDMAAKNTYYRVSNACRKLLKSSQATHAIAVFDGTTSWRYHYYPNYKHSRKPMPDALSSALTQLHKAFSDCNITAYIPDNDEADDVIATLANKASNNDIQSVIVSTDKGFLPLLSNNISVYDYFKGETISQDQVESKFKLQPHQLVDFWALNGDKTNDIPGVTGIGKQGALKLLHEFGSVSAAFEASDIPNELNRIFNKLNNSKNEYIRANLLVSLQLNIPLGFNLKALRLSV
jgi:protein Xni